MTTLLCTIIAGTLFVLCAYRAGQGSTGLNLLSAFGLLILLAWLLPELRGASLLAYGATWFLVFVGLQFAMPAAAGKRFVWAWQPSRQFIVVVARAG